MNMYLYIYAPDLGRAHALAHRPHCTAATRGSGAKLRGRIGQERARRVARVQGAAVM